MKWFFKTTDPNGLYKWRGPYANEDEADTAKAAFDENIPDHTSEEPFEADDDFLETCPKRYLTLDLVGGGQVAVYDDGDQVELP